ncbi:murein hydrolase activator EnvC family protein [Sporosarcina sp. FA9]|uniref:murein hydrolase activator EnvC family protein n=1 Tax=Sporosarcina sp. FA9 TaxID=3413030 RepID=UPI003F65F4D8
MKINKWILSAVMATFLMSSIMPNISAASLKDMKDEHNELEKKKNDLNSGIKQKTTEIVENQSTIAKIIEQITILNNKVTETNDNIERMEFEIEETTTEIEALKISIKDLIQKIKERDLVLRERVQVMQVKGNTVNYLDVLLGANSFSDFIDRFSAVSTLMDADRTIMKQQAADQEQLEVEKTVVEQKLAEQEENKSELEEMKKSLESQKNEKDSLVSQLEVEQSKLKTEKSNLEEDYHEAHELSKEVEQEIVAEQKRLAEVARKAAEEKKRKAAAAAAAARAAANNRNSSSSYTPPVSNGTWTRPASGRVSSEFGYRNHPIYGISKLHAGTDIANSIGTRVVAAGDGVVSTARFHGTLGNHIVVTHSVNGSIFTTVYAHLSSIGVSPGQVVEKGQAIGKIGSTGASTGPHLHFEFHVGYYSSGSGAVNPRRYVPI